MITTKARFLLIAISLVLVAWLAYQKNYELAALPAFGTAYLVWSHFRQGTVALAAKAYQAKNLDKAEKLLSEIKNPDRLSKKRRGYYEFILGNIELSKENFASAETHFQIASRFPLGSENDKGIVLVQLANLNLKKKEFAKAKAYLDVARDLKLTSRVRGIVQKIEQEIQKST